MNKIVGVLLLLVIASVANCQTVNHNDYVGKWDAEIENTSHGDMDIKVTIVEKENQLNGRVYTKDDGTVAIKKIEEENNAIVVYFKHGWFTVSLKMEKIDATHCKCRLADRYDGEAIRQKQSSRECGTRNEIKKLER